MTATARTAHLVALHQRIGSTTQRRRVPRARYPSLIEADVAERLVDMVRSWRDALAPFLDALPELLAGARYRADELDRVERIGLPISIENPVGSIRNWVDSDGTRGSTTMRYAYGFIDGAQGADGEEVDVYLGPVEEPEWVFIVRQLKKSSGFTAYDEDKVMLGWASADAAKAAYLEQYDDPRFFGGMTVMSRDEFITKLPRGGRLRFDDTAEGRRIRALMTRPRAAVASSAKQADSAAHYAARQVADHHRRDFSRQTKAALGVEVPTLDRTLPAQFDHFATETAKRVEVLGTRTLDAIETLAYAAIARGRSEEELVAEIVRRFAIAERHARFIARDQIGRILGQVRRTRHKEIGIRKFTWWSRADGKVRPSHKRRHGIEYPYTGKGAPPYFPGDEDGCRCEEEPVFDELRSLTKPPARASVGGYRPVGIR